MHILVVDDSKTVRNVIISHLDSLGFRDVSEADSGESAFYLVVRKKVDFIFLDWNMPKMNGIEFLAKIRGMSNHAKIPVLMVTTEGEREKVLQASALGIEGLVVKPFTKELLLLKVLEVFVKRGLKLPPPPSEPLVVKQAKDAADETAPAAGEPAAPSPEAA
jgi:two-component system chemotaxis response regulator CheY